MPTLPLYDPVPAHRDDSHHVIAPGGYECWRFDAEDTTANVRVVAELWDGHAFDPAYLRRYALYRRFPTRVDPPLPRDYRCASLAVFEAGTLLARFCSRVAALESKIGRNEVRLGANHMTRRADGALHVLLRGVPSTNGWIGSARAEETLTADLIFRPIASPGAPSEALMLTPISRSAGRADHRWVLHQPLCEVEGEIDFFRLRDSARVISLRGRGMHDRWYGSGPVAHVRQWVRGRSICGNRLVACSVANGEFVLIEADDSGVRRLQPPATTSAGRGKLGSLEIAGGRTVESSLTRKTELYKGIWDGGGESVFWKDIVRPRRLAWPLSVSRI